mmetsp:Transcript_132576/g.241330  ORF Transcript_132576/g.241330 Transcript_132576/m.241330 type:complete len:128 (-) Transcript_132576:90-473(-)
MAMGSAALLFLLAVQVSASELSEKADHNGLSDSDMLTHDADVLNTESWLGVINAAKKSVRRDSAIRKLNKVENAVKMQLDFEVPLSEHFKSYLSQDTEPGLKSIASETRSQLRPEPTKDNKPALRGA